MQPVQLTSGAAAPPPGTRLVYAKPTRHARKAALSCETELPHRYAVWDGVDELTNSGHSLLLALIGGWSPQTAPTQFLLHDLELLHAERFEILQRREASSVATPE